MSTYWIPPEFRDGVHLFILNRHTPSGQSRVYRVTTQLRTNGVHCRESAGIGPVNLKVVPNECCLGRLRLSFPHPLVYPRIYRSTLNGHICFVRTNPSSCDCTEIRTHVPTSEGFEVTNLATGAMLTPIRSYCRPDVTKLSCIQAHRVFCLCYDVPAWRLIM